MTSLKTPFGTSKRGPRGLPELREGREVRDVDGGGGEDGGFQKAASQAVEF